MAKTPPVPVPLGYRFCFMCERLLPLASFGPRRTSWDGRQSNCRPCTRVSSKRSQQLRKSILETVQRLRQRACGVPAVSLQALSGMCP